MGNGPRRDVAGSQCKVAGGVFSDEIANHRIEYGVAMTSHHIKNPVHPVHSGKDPPLSPLILSLLKDGRRRFDKLTMSGGRTFKRP